MPQLRFPDSDEGVEFVSCRICGDKRRVISGRHLSKHEFDREAYMREFGLTPDALIAKIFRLIQSSRKGYQPNGKQEWIAEIKALHERVESIFAGDLQDHHPHLYNQGVWIFGDWDKALKAAGFNPGTMRLTSFWDAGRVAKSITRLQKQRPSLSAHYVMKHHPDLFSAVRWHYGTWNKALIAAGVTKKPFRQLTPFVLLRELRNVLEDKRYIPRIYNLSWLITLAVCAKLRSHSGPIPG